MGLSRWPAAATLVGYIAATTPLAAQQAPSPEQKAANAARKASALADTLNTAVAFPAPRKFNHNHKISTTFDRFKNLTIVSGELYGGGFMNTSLFTADASFGYKGKTLSAPPRFVLITFYSTWPGDFRFLRNHEVQFLVDDSIPIEVGETLYDADVSTGGAGEIYETTAAILPVTQFLQIVNAKKVEFRLGGEGPAHEQRTLKEDQLELLRDLASRMTPSKAGS